MAVRRQQDVSAFTDLVATRSGALFRTAYLVVGDHQLAQDLLQEALVKAYAAWPKLRDPSKAEAYVRRTIVTTATSWRRRRSFHERPVEKIPETSSDDATEQLAVQDALWDELRSLPPRQRAALVLRYYEDLSEAQTAESMGCSVGTVKSQVSAALGKLRDRAGLDPAVLHLEDQAVNR
jgi:RNA polymerase sigma-70 factor (sigma-E family)